MQVSWIEPDELRDLASQLLDPEPQPSAASVELHTLPEPSSVPGPLLQEQNLEEGHPSVPTQSPPSPELEQIREKLKAIRDRAQDAGLLPVAKEPVYESAFTVSESDAEEPAELEPVTAAPVAEESAPLPSAPEKVYFLPLEGTISDRLNSFAVWAIDHTKSKDLIIIDDHGAPLWGDPTHNDLAVSSMLALNTNQRSSATGFNNDSALYSKIGTGMDLTIFRCLSRYGVVSVATVGDHPLSDDTVKDLREALLLAIDEAKI